LKALGASTMRLILCLLAYFLISNTAFFTFSWALSISVFRERLSIKQNTKKEVEAVVNKFPEYSK